MLGALALLGGVVAAYGATHSKTQNVVTAATCGSVTTSNPCTFGGDVALGPQAMDGALKVTPGQYLLFGYDFTFPGKHSEIDTMTFEGARLVLSYTCVNDKKTGGTFTINDPLFDHSYGTIAANDNSWIPSGDQQSSSTYQGNGQVPAACGPNGQLDLSKGGTFYTTFGYTGSQPEKVNIRWHYNACTDLHGVNCTGTGDWSQSGSWSGTKGYNPYAVTTTPPKH